MVSSSHQLKLGAIISYVAIFINIVAGLLYTPWMINSIGRENFGLYTLAMSVITLFVFDFGLSSSITRFIAKYLAEDNQRKANDCLGLVYRLYIAIDILLFILLVSVFFFIPHIYKELTPEEIEKFEVVYSIAAVYSVVSFPFIPINGVLNAHEKFIQVKACDVLHKLIIVGTMSICLLLGYGLYALVLVNALSGVITIGFKLYCIYRYTDQKINWNYFNKREFREIIGFSGWVTVIALAQRSIFNLAPSVLGVLSGSTAIAILGIAITMEGYTYTFANAINGMFLPKVSRIVVSEDGDVLPLMTRIGRIQIYIVGLILLGVICFGHEFIHLWVGDGFSDSYYCAILIIVPSLFYLPKMIGIETVYAKNQVKKMAIVQVLMAVFNLIGAVLLSSSMGAIGICISICVAYMVRTLCMDIIFYKDLRIDMAQFYKDSFAKMMFPILLCGAVGYVCGYLIPFHSWVGFIIKVGSFVVAYVAIMYIMVMNNDEKSLIFHPLRRIVKK